jgi:hypothetical protein
MKKPDNTIFHTMFFQSWGTFTNETLVAVGVTKKELITFLKRRKAKPELIERLDHKLVIPPGSTAFVWTSPDTGCTLLWMDSFNNVYEDMCTLVHETNHLVYDIARDKGFQNEPEVQAYQQEYLFRHIVAELQDRWKKFGVKSSKTGGSDAIQSSVAQGANGDVPSMQSRFEGCGQSEA